ncbi:MAG: HipA domain-containing protein [Ilumatobacteraceae bacterium]
MSSELLIWRDGIVHGVVTERRGNLTLRYEQDARPISVTMPVRSAGYGDRHARTWLRGLLPEGQIRAMIAYDLNIAGADDFALLTALGKDCAGALSFRPDGADPDDTRLGSALDEQQIGQLLRSLPTSPMGVEQGFRVSLPGNQSKLLLTRVANRWHRPDGAPSTHILKPAVRDLHDNTVHNEAYCQHLAAAAGLPAATTTIATFDGTRVLLSERFDRVHDRSLGRRVHQEDGCQATIIDPTQKYQTDSSGPSLSAIAAALSANGGQLAPLLRLVVFTVAIGNADLHGKNVSLTFHDDDSVALSPIYDAMSTRLYDTSADGQPVVRDLGMRVGGRTSIDDVTHDDLIAEARSWGITARTAHSVVDTALDGISAALDTIEAPLPELRALIAERLDNLTPRQT